MKELLNNIQIIYTETDAAIAENIFSFLKEKTGNRHLPSDAAVIIVSDEATADPQWQKDVRSLNPAVRLVPAGAIVNADYSDPAVIPSRIEELNFIRIDEDLHQNLWDSLNLDQDFYNVRNAVLVNMNSWLISEESDAFLMTDYGQVRKCLRMVQNKAATETDERFQKQLHDMEDYLNRSLPVAKKLFFRTLRQRLTLVLAAAVLIAVVYAGITVISNLQRAARESALLGQDPSEANAAENFVLLSDGVNNSYIDESVRAALFNEMTSYLDLNWTTTPVGYNYKYRLYDPHFLGNEQYLMLTNENSHTLVFDTYTGKITQDFGGSSQPVKAYYVDLDNRYVIVVTTENQILFGDADTSQWLTNNYEYPFTGNSDVRILARKGGIVIYDDKNEFYYTVDEETGIRPATYLRTDTMGTDNYTIHDIKLYETETVSATEIEGEMSVYYSDHQGGMTGYSTGISGKPDCTASVSQNNMIFADKDGNVLLFEREKRGFHAIGLKLPDVRYLVLINDSVLAYHDTVLGTRLYDFRQQADLGEVLSGFRDITWLGAGEYTIMCYSDGAYHCQPLSTILPQTEIDETTVLKTYNTTSPADEGLLSNVRYENGLIRYEMDVVKEGQSLHLPYVLDGARLLPAGSAISDRVLADADARGYQTEPLAWNKEVTVIGLTDGGLGFVVGTSDGQFREFSMEYNGFWLSDSSFQIPTRSAITAIHETETNYWLEDESHHYWYAGKRYPSHDEGSTLLLDLMNEKMQMHGYFKQDLLDSVDPQTISDLGIQLMPGGDGKEWE